MKDQSITKRTLGLFWFHASRYKHLLFPLFISIPAAVVVLDFVTPYITAQVLQKISDGAYDSNNLLGSFGSYILAYATAIFVSGVAIWRLNVWLIWHLELRVQRDIAQRIFEHLMKMSASFHANRFSGSLVSQTNKFMGAYVRFVDSTVFNLYTLVIAMLATFIILTPRAPLYVVVILTLTVVYVVGTLKFSKPVREANRIEAETQSKQTGYLSDSISNVMAVKSFAAGNYEKKRFWEAASHTRNMGIRSMHTTLLRETYSSLITSSINVSSLVIAIVGAGVFKTNVSTIFLISAYTANIGHRLWEFQNVLRQYNRALGDASDMVKILQIESEVKDPLKPEKPRIIHGGIKLNKVAFAHGESSDPLFTKLDLDIKPGEKIGLVGHSGSGKTTLAKLLLRFADIDTGSITIDGQDIRHITQDDLRQHIAYVPQEPLLFHRTLAENISYGRINASEQAVRQAAKQANAAEFIEKLPKGYETLVGERGVKLSGGQRQRVAIARAMLKDAPILVLDEATSSLDSESEKLIQDALWKLMEGRTAIVIAHRLSTIQKMDRIIVLEEGNIVEEGSHKELLAKKGVYATLWAHQSGGFLEE